MYEENEMEIKVEIGGEAFKIALTKEFSPKTVEKIVGSLPIESEVKKWGDEIYFDVPVENHSCFPLTDPESDDSLR
ncbi:MAG TPA: hypothetical protein ENI32_08450 [Candidatus Syntrophoarchaeum butanivorans]|uniref:Cyclophilin TM1367-like domain-containing protein n=1 Tax=Candidatus Syntropharchaeum butanivorans TaxID=1839936 RepID=A0A1F2P556_9EURY|nr:MAG: hypothetical protein SBU_000836 [Candidatus Syntrophoarchaeum butanivorans]HEC57878.1 hypothetical protein [Candidatus Syntrophoarchaeum butanivorans]